MSVKRKTASQTYENEARKSGYNLIGGMDEAGRGPLAGPVCAAVVIFEPGVRIAGVFDSKALDREIREELYDKIMSKAMAVGVGLACAEEIDQYNILRATKLAARRALRQMAVMPDYLLLDALTLDKVTIAQMPITKGDAKSFSIAAASIIAKVTRDRLMMECSEQYPDYGFESHKGYGTPSHRKCIREMGPTSLHRQSFLEAWFDTNPIRHSRLYHFLHERLTSCEAVNDIHELLTHARQHKHWLPVLEWKSLNKLASQRSEELAL